MLPPLASAGSVLIGSMLAYFLFGAYCVQLAASSQALDRNALRLLVCATTACLVLHLVFATQQAWKMLVVFAGDPEMLDWPPKHTVLAIPALNGLLALLVQGYFAWRVWMICQNDRLWIRTFVPSLIIVTSVVQFGATIVSTVIFRHMDGRFTDLFELKAPIATHLGSAVVSDTLITGSMVYILNRYKAKATFVKTRNLLNTLIINVIENGLITTVCAAANLISFLAGAPSLVAYAFQYVMGGLYAVVLVVTLNRRRTAKVQNDVDAPSQGVELLQFTRTRRPFSGTFAEDVSATFEAKRQPLQNDPSAGIQGHVATVPGSYQSI